MSVLRYFLFIAILVSPAYTSAQDSDRDRDLEVGECVQTFALGQPAKACRDKNGELRILPLQSSTDNQHHADEMELDRLGTEFLALQDDDKQSLAKASQILQQVIYLQNKLAERSYDTSLIAKDTEGLENRISQKITEMSSPPSETGSGSALSAAAQVQISETVSRPSLAEAAQVQVPAGPNITDPYVSYNKIMPPEDASISDLWLGLFVLLALAGLFLFASERFVGVARFTGIKRQTMSIDQADQVIFRYLKLHRYRKLYFWASVACSAWAGFACAPVFWILMPMLSWIIWAFILRSHVDDSFFSVDKGFNLTGQEIASIYPGTRYTKCFRHLLSDKSFLTTTNSSGMLILTPERFWARQGKVYSVGDTSKMKMQTIHTNIQTRSPSDKDEVIESSWRYAKRTKPEEPDLRFNNNFRIFIIRHYALKLSFPDGSDWRFPAINRVAFESVRAAFSRILYSYRDEYEEHRQSGQSNQQKRQKDKTSETSDQTGHAGKTRSWFEILNVPSDAPWSLIKKAFHEQAQKCHPDRVSGLDPDFAKLAHEKFIELQRAYEEARKLHKQ